MLECWIGWLRAGVTPPTRSAASCAARRERIAAQGKVKKRYNVVFASIVVHC